ncbi:MAG TPA: tetratricopeptide repeat protein [Gemmatimonadales bacterium]|nr:tetratricopeptide repeat protein [Gemmatimonadales bacterium]
MAYTSEIDKLEARFRDNPKGRNFAPLADAYRKAGLIDNAIDLCQNGLKLHPDYVSAYIVYARCLVDKKDDPGALGVFTKVLELDGENIIALRGLAELAERNGRYEEEVDWLTRLINADPMNGDAAEALARAKGKAASKPTEPASPAAIAEAPTAAMAKPDFDVDKETPEPVELKAPATESAPSADIENFESPISFNPNAHEAAKAEGLEVQEDVELNPQQIEQVEIEGLARTQYEGSGMFRLDAPEPPDAAGAASEPDDSMPKVDLPLIMPDDELLPQESKAAPPPAPRPPPPPPAPTPRVPAAVALSDDDGAADTATLSKAEPVLTETMAELYLKQGHHQDALRVYQALLAQRPNDAKLKAKVEQLSSGGKKGSGVSAQAFLKSIWSGARARPSEPQSTLAAAFDVAEPAASANPLGEPSRPAQDHISLDTVFGDEGARRPPQESAPTPAATAAPEAPDGSKTGGFSFDEFFAGGNKDAASAPGTPEAARTPGASRTSGRTQKPPEDEAEADQFQQWLKKLKS